MNEYAVMIFVALDKKLSSENFFIGMEVKLVLNTYYLGMDRLCLGIAGLAWAALDFDFSPAVGLVDSIDVFCFHDHVRKYFIQSEKSQLLVLSEMGE